MSIEVKILGIGSASPVYKRHPSAHYLSINNNHFFLIDCGEATQFQLLKYKISHTRITHIFISHLHGDHYYGLIGLISTMQLMGRKKALYIYGPKGLDEILTVQLKHSQSIIEYPLHFTTVDTTKHYTLVNHNNYTVQTIPLSHRIGCCGFLFKEKPKRRRLVIEKLPSYITPLQRIALKEGEDIIDNETGFSVLNKDVTLDPRKSYSYAYCSDTAYLESILPIIRNVDLLYHEATFHSDLQERAVKTFHSTAKDAATIALKAETKNLIIGHFSSRYKELEPLLLEAQEIFPNTTLAEEGKTYTVND